MYNVSDEYLEAMRKPYRKDGITGRINFKDGDTIRITDSILVQGKLTITRKACGNKYDIGTFNMSELVMTIRDDLAYDHDFGGAAIDVKYRLVTGLDSSGNEKWETVPMGFFFADGEQTSRRGNIVTIRAYDNASKFDIDLPDLNSVSTMWGALEQAYLRANVGCVLSEETFNMLPNATITPDFSDKRIQTCRDLVMWIAQATNCIAYINRDGKLALRQYKYMGGDAYDREYTAGERKRIEFTDTRTYLAYLSSYNNGKTKVYSKLQTWTGDDAPHIREGALQLSENPLLAALDEATQDTANLAILDGATYPTRYIKAQAYVDPATDIMDVLAFGKGAIDIGQIISVCTEVKWKYRGIGTIICNNIPEYTEDEEISPESSANSLMLTAATATTSDMPTVMRIPPKSQVEKRLDSLGNRSGLTADKLQTTGSKYYAVTRSKNAYDMEFDGLILSNGNTEVVIRDNSGVDSDDNPYHGWLIQNKATEGFRVLSQVGNNTKMFDISGGGMNLRMQNSTLSLSMKYTKATGGIGYRTINLHDDHFDIHLNSNTYIEFDSNGFDVHLGSGINLSFTADGLTVNGKKVALTD